MRYCSHCVLPDTRPGLTIGPDGVCSACKGHLNKLDGVINWQERREELLANFRQAKERSRGYDCLIPVSGGKDSTWQVVKCLEQGLRILAVTWKTPGRTALGQQNLDNLVKLGVDHIDYTINPAVEKRFMCKTLLRTGSTAVPMHLAIFSIPLKMAVAFQIPLIVWGESPFMEYVGEAGDDVSEAETLTRLDYTWLRRHGILQGTLAEDWLDKELTRKDLEPYFLPPEENFKAANIKSIFLGYYLPWDPRETVRVALDHGFQLRAAGPKTGYYNYADIDCDFISVHHHFKWLKFGFTRLFDNLSLEIRNGRLTREAALTIIKEKGDQTPHSDIARICEFMEISREHFAEIEENFRNKAIWIRESGRWKIPNFIISDWKW